MERALNLGLLRAALGEGGMFPSPEELQRRLAEAEIALFLRRGAVDEELLGTAWYLHGVGTARASLEIYPVDRQLRANQVAAQPGRPTWVSTNDPRPAHVDLTLITITGS